MKKLALNEIEKEILLEALESVNADDIFNKSDLETFKILLLALKKL
jgi:hypothetical protein